MLKRTVSNTSLATFYNSKIMRADPEALIAITRCLVSFRESGGCGRAETWGKADSLLLRATTPW